MEEAGIFSRFLICLAGSSAATPAALRMLIVSALSSVTKPRCTELSSRDSASAVEGYPTARSAWNLAQSRNVDTPIIDEVYAMLHEGKDLRQALLDLTTRVSKAED